MGPPRIAVVSAVASVISVIAVVASVIAQVTNDPIYLWQPPLLLVDRDAHLEKTDSRLCPSDFFSCLSFTQSDLWSQQAPIASVFEVQHSGYPGRVCSE